jgi:hypothetical protein
VALDRIVAVSLMLIGVLFYLRLVVGRDLNMLHRPSAVFARGDLDARAVESWCFFLRFRLSQSAGTGCGRPVSAPAGGASYFLAAFLMLMIVY